MGETFACDAYGVCCLWQVLEEEFAREKREQQLFYDRGNETIPDHSASEFHTLQEPDGKPTETAGSQHGSQKSQDDNSSSKSSTGSLEV